MCLYIPRPTPVIFLSFGFLSLRVVLAAFLSSKLELTPLHAAAIFGHAEVVKVLLAAGANVHATDNVSLAKGGGRLDYRDGSVL